MSNLNRRSFVKNAALTAGAVAVGSAELLHASCTTLHFDITPNGAVHALNGGNPVTLANDTVIQSFCFDTTLDRLWTLQATHGGQPYGNLLLSWIDLTTWKQNAPNHYMVLNGFGHGQGFYVTQPTASTTTIWVECDAVVASDGNAYGSKVCSFNWVEASGTNIYSSTSSHGYTSGDTVIPSGNKHNLVPGGEHICVTGDPCNNRLVVRSLLSGVNNIQIFEMSTLQQLHTFTQYPMVVNGTGSTEPFQGLALFSNYCYYSSGFAKGQTGQGTSCSDATAQPSHLYYQSTEPDQNHAGASAQTNAYYQIARREPEGLSIWDSASGPRLVYCYSGYANSSECGGTSNLVTWFCYKDTLIS
jgi:hypothetical protein